MKLIIYLLLISISSFTFASEEALDFPTIIEKHINSAEKDELKQLKIKFQQEKNDTLKIKLLFEFIDNSYNENVWPKINEFALNLLEEKLKSTQNKKITNKKEIFFFNQKYAEALNNKGYWFGEQGNINKQEEYYRKSLALNLKNKDKKGIGFSYNNLGYIFDKKGDIPQALDYYLKSLKIKEEIKDSAGIGTTLVNLGYNYDKLGEYNKALDYYKKSLLIRKKINDDYGVANSYNLIAALYQRMAIKPEHKHLMFKSLELFEKTLKINQRISNHTGIAESYNNIGTYYQQLLNYDLALKQYKLANQIQLEINDVKGYTQTSYNIGNIYFIQNNFKEAEKYALISYKTAKSMGFPQEINDASKLLYLIEKNKGNLKKSLYYFEEHILMKDSVQNEDIRRQNLELNINYEYEKQKSADSIRNLEAQKVKDAEIKAQKAQINQKRTQNIALGTGIILILVFSSLLFKKFKQTQKQNGIIIEQKREVEVKNDLIEEQHFLLEEKNKEITDSIKYAERIQGAILPPDQKWNYILPNSFVLNKPKDILSGDFYWIAENENKIFVAAADCTGHGVPGALISIVNFNLLNKAVLERGLEKPSEILDAVNKWLTESLNQTTSESTIKDGMDISLISMDKKNGQILYAGANNPLYIFNGDELLEYKADKFPVGAYLNEEMKNFTTKEIQAKYGDTIYLFSDGFADQFGGPDGKKFKYKQFKELLFEAKDLKIENQKEKLFSCYRNWRGKLEQTDDILVIGIKL